jgi:poly(3-hydroxybutyrate) depolymerase
LALELGVVPVKLPEFSETAVAYVPERFEGRVPLGLVVWTKAAGGEADDKLIERWKSTCDASELILLVVRSRKQAAWEPAEAELVRRAMEHVGGKYNADRSRVALFGEGADGVFAMNLAMALEGRVTAAAVVEAALAVNVEISPTEPLKPLSIYSAQASESKQARRIEAGVARLRKLKYPVTSKTLPAGKAVLAADELAELGRWLDALDRL